MAGVLVPMPFASVDEAFAELLRRIELNPTRVALASQRYNAVKATIESALSGKTVRQIGSFQRKTKIKPSDLSDRLDVDLVVSFGPFFQYAPSGKGGTSPNDALRIVRGALASNDKYRVMPQEVDHPVIRLDYADEMTFELVPAFEDKTGQHQHADSQPNCYIIGASPTEWRLADYDYDALVISTLNSVAEKRLVPSIKMVKAYFRAAKLPLESFHTEILVASIVPNTVADWEGKHDYGYPHILASFLSQAATVATRPVILPGSFSPPTNSNLPQEYLAKLGIHFAFRAEAAWQICADTNVNSAIARWRAFFGDPFPT